MENQKLFDVMEHWLQGRINTCVSGLFSRIERLEEERSELFSRIEDMQSQINDLHNKLDGAKDERHRRIRNEIESALDVIDWADLIGDDLREIVQNELKYVDIPEHLSDRIAREIRDVLSCTTIKTTISIPEN